MLRPATPLTILLLASFVLLLISVLSAPIIKAVPIASRQGVNFGVLGFCTPERCSGPRVGYNTDERFGNDNAGIDFTVPSSTRRSLSALLIVHPIAALFNLVCLALAGAAHFHSPSHSARYLLALLILLLPTLLVTLLAFLVDILVFVPHLRWGGWIVLASTVLITASGVVTCAMRRTLVSRKARKKRIAENPEMSGESFYNRQNSQPKMDFERARTNDGPKIPMVNGAPGSDRLPALTTTAKAYDTAVWRSDLGHTTRSNTVDNGSMGYKEAHGEALRPVRSRSQEHNSVARERYGESVPSSVSSAVPPDLRRDPSEPSPEPWSSQERLTGSHAGPRGGFGYGGPRGRGGYPSRGGYASTRGGFAGPQGSYHGYGRGGYNDGGTSHSGGRGRGGLMADAVGTGMVSAAQMGSSQPGSPPGYPPQGARVSPEQFGPQDPLRRVPVQAFGEAADGPQQASLAVTGRTPSRGFKAPSPQNGSFVGQAVEMNAVTGRVSQAAGIPSGLDTGHDTSQLPNLRSPSSEHGSDGAPRPSNMAQPADMASRSDIYGHEHNHYVPPRAAWPSSNGQTSSPFGGRLEYSPGAMPSQPSSHYYEDVEFPFSDVHTPAPEQQPTLPTSLIPGGSSLAGRPLPRSHGLQPTSSDENLQDGARSPTGSETSHFTSVSQRGVNPRWGRGSEDARPMPPPPPPSMSTTRKPVPGRPVPKDREVLLQNNPDFEIPGMRPPGRGVDRGGPMSGQPPGTGARAQMPLGGNGLTGVGRYPQP